MELLKGQHGILMELNADTAAHKNMEDIEGSTHTNLTNKEDKLHRTKSFQVPVFNPPYPLRVHPLEAESCKAIHCWLLHHSIDTVFHPEKFEKLLFCPALAARTYPDTSSKGLDLVSKLMTVTWLVDDAIDDSEIESSWEASLSLVLEIHLVMMSFFPDEQTLLMCLMEFVDNFCNDRRKDIQNLIKDVLYSNNDEPCKSYSGKLSPIASSFHDFWVGAMEIMKTESSLRLAQYFQKFMISSLIQIQNRQDNVIPSLEEYVLLRRNSGAFICFLVIVDLTDNVFLPQEILDSPGMQRLINLVNDLISWHNDIWSFKKEYLLHGDVHNLVFLASHHLNCSYEKAALVITKMLYVQCLEVEIETKELLKVTPLEHQHVVSRYIAACKHWISGTDDWHKKSLRYK